MRKHPGVIAVLLLVAVCHYAFAFDSFITMQDEYFYDPGAGEPWVPHGVAYQTWNRPLGVWQTQDQIEYDLDEMVKLGANSVRIDRSTDSWLAQGSRSVPIDWSTSSRVARYDSGESVYWSGSSSARPRGSWGP